MDSSKQKSFAELAELVKKLSKKEDETINGGYVVLEQSRQDVDTLNIGCTNGSSD